MVQADSSVAPRNSKDSKSLMLSYQPAWPTYQPARPTYQPVRPTYHLPVLPISLQGLPISLPGLPTDQTHVESKPSQVYQ